MLVARLTPRLRQLLLPTFSAYYDYVLQDQSGGELDQLINRITTNKTSFFREPYHFDFLRTRVIPEIRNRNLRIWSSACSSGEEPYSIAMAVKEALGSGQGWDIRILASDIDTEMLARAESGIYSLESLQGIPEHLLRAHFLRGYGKWSGMAKAGDDLRPLIEFRRINLIGPKWALHTTFDVIFCRNVIIYFDRETQEGLIRRLAACLKPGGYLFTGHSENLFWLRDLFTTMQPTIYRLNPGVAL